MYVVVQLKTCSQYTGDPEHVSLVMRKPTMWSPNRSDTNRAVQAQKMARGWISKVDECTIHVVKTKALISLL